MFSRRHGRHGRRRSGHGHGDDAARAAGIRRRCRQACRFRCAAQPRQGLRIRRSTSPGSSAAVTRDIVLQIGRVSDTLSVTASRGAREPGARHAVGDRRHRGGHPGAGRERARGRAAVRAWRCGRRHRPRGRADVAVLARRRVRLQPRADRRRPRQPERRRVRLQPHRRQAKSSASKSCAARSRRCGVRTRWASVVQVFTKRAGSD